MPPTANSSLGCGSPSKRPDAGTGDRSRASYVRTKNQEPAARSVIHKPEAQAKVIPGIEEPLACASGLSVCELDRQQDGHVVLPRRCPADSPEQSRHKPHVLPLPSIMNPRKTLCDHGNPAESIDETNEQGPKGLIAARARRCSTCGVVSGCFDEQVPPPLITWCCRAALFPGGTASMTHPTLTMSCCRVLGSIGGGTCFSFDLTLQATHPRLLLPG